MNTGVHGSFQVRVFILSGSVSTSGITGSHGTPIFSLLKNLHTAQVLIF